MLSHSYIPQTTRLPTYHLLRERERASVSEVQRRQRARECPRASLIPNGALAIYKGVMLRRIKGDSTYKTRTGRSSGSDIQLHISAGIALHACINELASSPERNIPTYIYIVESINGEAGVTSAPPLWLRCDGTACRERARTRGMRNTCGIYIYIQLRLYTRMHIHRCIRLHTHRDTTADILYLLSVSEQNRT